MDLVVRFLGVTGVSLQEMDKRWINVFFRFNYFGFELLGD